MKTLQYHQKSERIVQKHRLTCFSNSPQACLHSLEKDPEAERRSVGEENRKLPPLTNYCRTINMKTNKFIYFLASSPVVLGASSFVFLTWLISLPVVHYFISNGGEYFYFHGL